MKKYETLEEQQIKAWRTLEKFTEMSRIGNLHRHKDISVWVNERGEEREEPHFHVRFSSGDVLRIKFKDLKSMDKKELDASLLKEFIKWLESPTKQNAKITNMEFAIMIWNSQNHLNNKLKIQNFKWYTADDSLN
jgi:hypothetical protein